MTQHKRGWTTTKTFKTILIVIAAVIVIRLILPYIILHYANKSLANMEGYYGHIEDIDLAIIRGAYKIDSVYLNKVDSVSGKQTPFLSASVIDLSIEWKALFHGSIVGEAIFESPMIRFTKEKVEPETVRKDSAKFDNLADEFMPLRVNRLEINNGRVQYIDNQSNPKVDVQMTNLQVLALNLKNSYDSAAVLPASIRASANVYDGELTFNMKLNPLAEIATYDMNAEAKDINLVKLNDFFKAYAKIDVNKGKFGLYTEVAAKEGRFEGYVKPLLQDLDVLGKEDREDNVFRKMWEGLAGGLGEVFENQSKDQVATKIPFRGNVENPTANIWYAIVQVLQNAFIQAIQPSIDNEINIASVDTGKKEKKTFLEKIFSGKEDKDADGKKDNKDKRKDDDKEKRKDDGK
ncbi:MAG TPA: DUF748 domain-containing protein [Ohtaekwangia sp.]|nr:DUF748 domain-containing protein [Ohtaekwangia sp.]